jgi:hypothetical protein
MGLENKVASMVTGKLDRLAIQAERRKAGSFGGKKRGSEGDSVPPIKIRASGGK